MIFEHLFTPIQIGSMTVKNRIGLPPMTVGYGTADATLTDRHRAYYETRAMGGAGLIVTEAAAINGNRKYGLFPLGLYEDAQIPSWAKLADAVHPYGTKVGVQLMDPGPESIQMLTGVQPVGPSAVVGRSHFRSLPREMSTGEVEAVVEDFAEAVGRARDAGLDCVQIHAAHGYAMVGSFLSPFFNKRTDRYGGSLEGRLQFLLEIIAAVRAKVGRDFPLMLRMSGDEHRTGGRTLQETQFIARALVAAGVDGLEISGGAIPTVFYAVVPPQGTELAPNAPYAQAIREVVDVPILCVGRINTPQLAEFVIATGRADLVSMGRALNADPEMPNKAAEGRLDEIRPCVGCNEGCISAVMKGLPAGCILNTGAGKEIDGPPVATDRPKRVLVAGGGPAGLEAARIAAVRGHDVTLVERREKLGAERLHRFVLFRVVSLRYRDQTPRAVDTGSQGDGLTVVSSCGGDDPPLAFLGSQVRHQVQTAPDLEGSGRIVILVLDVSFATQPPGNERVAGQRSWIEVAGDQASGFQNTLEAQAHSFVFRHRKHLYMFL